MVLKFEGSPKEVYMLEATGNYGVAINKWSFLRDHVGKKKFYSRMMFRHVNFDRETCMGNL
jgi:hypothetical protein